MTNLFIERFYTDESGIMESEDIEYEFNDIYELEEFLEKEIKRIRKIYPLKLYYRTTVRNKNKVRVYFSSKDSYEEVLYLFHIWL